LQAILSFRTAEHPFVYHFSSSSFIHSFFKMLSFTILLAASALTGSVLAKPIPIPQEVAPKKGFTLAQSVAKPYQAGPVALQKAYLKYNMAVPDAVKAAAADGSVTATPEQFDAEYLCPVTIGGQTLNLDFDTGSSDLYVLESPNFPHR
jgi:aspergillopepsin I